MVYVDASLLVALLTPEPGSPRVRAWFEGNAAPLATADWGAVEFASAIAAKRRAKALRPSQVKAARDAFERLTTGGLRLLPVSRSACQRAVNLCAAPGSTLRAGDALHLAIAQEAGCAALAGLDETMNNAAAALGLKVLP